MLKIRLKKLKIGKHKLTITYLGSASTASSSAKVTIKVVKGAEEVAAAWCWAARPGISRHQPGGVDGGSAGSFTTTTSSAFEIAHRAGQRRSAAIPHR